MYRLGKTLSLLGACLLLLGSVTAACATEAGADTASKTEAAASPATFVPRIDSTGLLAKVTEGKGKVVVINIFASWCPPCRDEAPTLIATRKSFKEDEVLLIGVSVDQTPKALYAFMDEHKLNYPIFLAEGNFIEAFGVNAIPQLLIYNKKGELAFNHKGLVEPADLTKAIKRELAK